MNEKEIFDTVQEIICHQFGILPESIKPDTDLQYNFRMDSLDRVKIFMYIEDRLKCQLTDEEENLLHESFNADPTPKTIVRFFAKRKIYCNQTRKFYTKSLFPN